MAFHVIKISSHVWSLTCGRQSPVRNCGDSQCGVSLRTSVLLTKWSTLTPSSCSLFSQISDKFLWVPASLSCTQHFCPSSSSTILCSCCSKLIHVPNEAPFLSAMCRHVPPPPHWLTHEWLHLHKSVTSHTLSPPFSLKTSAHSWLHHLLTPFC